MQRTLLLSARKRGRGGAPDVRLYTMTDAQAVEFAALCNARGAASAEAAHAAATATVVAFLGGRPLPEHAPPALHQARRAFPALRNAQVEALPRIGPPDQITALVLVLQGPDGAPRTVRYDLGPAVLTYRFMLRELMRAGLTRTEAWLEANKIVGRMLAGAQPADNAGAMIEQARAAFPTLTDEQAHALPDATEDDVREHSCCSS